MWEQKISPTELAAERQRLMQLFETETDPSVMEVETQRLLAKLRDVHTNAHLFSLKSPSYFPLYYLQSHDSLFIANIGQVEKADSAVILGSLIEQINGFSRAEFNAKIGAFEGAEDANVALYKNKINNPKYLKIIGLATQTDSVRLTLKIKNGERRDVILHATEPKKMTYFNLPKRSFPYKVRSDNYNYTIDKKNDLAYLNVGTMLDYVCYADGFKQYVKNPLLRPLAKAWMKRKAQKSGNLNFKKFA